MKKINLLLIRHGKTEANEKRLYCGKSNISLSSLGKKEVEELKEIYRVYEVERFFTSGAKRANETLEILFQNNIFKELKEFWEYDFGDFEMKSYEMLKENQEYIDWILDKKGDVICPNGESKNQYKERIKKAFEKLIDELIKEQIDNAVLVSHGGTVGILLEIFSKEKGNFYDLQPSCGLGYEVEVLVKNQEIQFNIKNKFSKER